MARALALHARGQRFKSVIIHKNKKNNLCLILKTDSKVFLKNDDEFKKIIEESTKWSEIGEKLNYNPPISSNVKRVIEYRCSLLGINVNIVNKKQEVSSQTKRDLFEKRKN